MTDLTGNIADAARQQSIRAKSFHPTGRFVEFKKEEIEQSISNRFEEQVRRYPDRLAVKTRSHQFTYNELNKAANRVAHTILAQRVEEEEPIALLLDQGAQLISTILSVLKAGRAIVPLDPSYPHPRTSYMLEDSRAGLIVTNNKNLSLATELARNGIQLLNIDEIDASHSTEDLGLSISPDTLAYILYTSGSTGQPKGVVQNHRNVLHQIMIYTNTLHVSADDRLTLLTTITGQAINTIFNALLNGASLYPLDIKEEGLTRIATWLIQEEISIYVSGSPLFRHFIDTLTGEEEFPKLRLIRLASQTVFKRDMELYKKHFSLDCLFVNGLSSGETGRTLNYFVDRGTQITTSTVPIGFAVEDTEVLLLDDAGKVVGVNCIGEIAVKSRYLSPGYWKRPDLTCEAFLPDPAGGDERIYRTGDLGRMLPDGCLVHLGRKDFQVKIRGYRIEVAEVEMALLDLDIVKEAVVVAQEIVSGNKRLVAYIVPTGQPVPTVTELRRALAEKLADYMVPSAFVILDTLPLTPNGKVDRRALPAPGQARPELASPFVAPRTPIEEEMVWIWAEVLKLEQVGVHDNFFDLGGDSLLATRVISRIINTFQIELPVKSLFESPTVADMAEIVTQNRAKKVGQEDLTRMLNELVALSDEEVRHLLADECK